MSGHIFFADKWYGFDDAPYSAVRLLGIVARMEGRLSAVRAALPQVINTPELRFDCPDTRKFGVIQEVKQRLAAEGAKVQDVDGVRVLTEDGWWLLRASNTQAVLVARAEARDEAGLERLKAGIARQLEASGLAAPTSPGRMPGTRVFVYGTLLDRASSAARPARSGPGGGGCRRGCPGHAASAARHALSDAATRPGRGGWAAAHLPADPMGALDATEGGRYRPTGRSGRHRFRATPCACLVSPRPAGVHLSRSGTFQLSKVPDARNVRRADHSLHSGSWCSLVRDGRDLQGGSAYGRYATGECKPWGGGSEGPVVETRPWLPCSSRMRCSTPASA
jgi:hypothetical protein